jgi:hypothetical protein
MGLLSWLLGGKNTETEQTKSAQDEVRIEAGEGITTVEYKGEQLFCETATSPNGRYTVAYHDRSPVLLVRDGSVLFEKDIPRPNACQVTDDGLVAVVDWIDHSQELAGVLHVFQKDGTQVLRHEFDANLDPVAVTPDGAFVATSTLNPDCSTYIFDTETGELRTKHENIQGNKMGLRFENEDDDWVLYLSETEDDYPLYGIDLDGEVVWKSDELEREERIEQLTDSDDTDDLEQAISELEEAYELSDDENQQKSIANKLADAHWTLARNIKTSDGITDECWKHLNEAYRYYTEVLPWYDGKQGVAKVRRLQGKHHLKEDSEDAALECFEEIERLEEEHDVQLLTDADKRKLDDLR